MSIKATVCRTGESAVVSSFNLHFGKAALLVGGGGSGTIFFARCHAARLAHAEFECAMR